MYTMLPLLTHVLYIRICLSSGSVKVILTCYDSAYPFTAVVPYPVCICVYLPCVAVMLDRWSNSPVTVCRMGPAGCNKKCITARTMAQAKPLHKQNMVNRISRRLFA